MRTLVILAFLFSMSAGANCNYGEYRSMGDYRLVLEGNHQKCASLDLEKIYSIKHCKSEDILFLMSDGEIFIPRFRLVGNPTTWSAIKGIVNYDNPEVVEVERIWLYRDSLRVFFDYQEVRDGNTSRKVICQGQLEPVGTRNLSDSL